MFSNCTRWPATAHRWAFAALLILGACAGVARADSVQTFVAVSNPDLAVIQIGKTFKVDVTLSGTYYSDFGAIDFNFNNATPDPIIDWYVDGVLQGSPALKNGKGTLSYTVPSTIVGATHRLQARFRGGTFDGLPVDANDLPPSENGINFVVDGQVDLFYDLNIPGGQMTQYDPLNFSVKLRGQYAFNGTFLNFDWVGIAPEPVLDWYVDGAYQGRYKMPDGKYAGFFDTVNLGPGNHTLRLTFLGGTFEGVPRKDPIQPFTRDFTFNIAAKPNSGRYGLFTFLEVVPSRIDPGQNVTVEAILGWIGRPGDYYFAQPAAGKPVQFFIDDTLVGSGTTDGNGRVTAVFRPNVGAGFHFARIRFNGGGFDGTSYAGAAYGRVFVVNKLKADIKVRNASGHIGQLIDLTATLKRFPGGAPIASKTLIFRVNNRNVGAAVTGVNGTATLKYTVLESLGTGSKRIHVDYNGDADYFKTAGAATLFVVEATRIAVADTGGSIGQTVPLTATLTRSGSASGVAGKKISFSVAGQNVGQATTDASGKATLNYALPESLGVGDRLFTARFAGDPNFDPSSADGKLTVTKAATTIVVPDVAGNLGQTVTLTATLQRLNDSAPLSNRTLTFRVADTVVGMATTNGAGVATLSYSIGATGNAGESGIVVEYAGEAVYDLSNGSAKLTVTRAATSLAFPAVSGAPGSTVTLKVTLTRDYDSAPVAGKTVAFKMDTTDLGTAVTGADGVATRDYAIPLDMDPGDRTVTATFAGDVTYAVSTTEGVLTVAKVDTAITTPDLTGAFGDTVVIAATLTQAGTGTALAGKTVIYLLDDSPIGQAITDAGGVAALVYTVPGPDEISTGIHVVTVQFAGDQVYNSTNWLAGFNITQATPFLDASDLSGKQGTSVTLKARIYRADGVGLAGRTVTLYVDRVSVGTVTTDGGGNTTLDYAIPADMTVGDHEILVQFAGDDAYLPAVGLGTLTVTP